MKFIYPSFLWTLFLIAIPIIIHLVNLRRHQTVYFSNVNFLKRVKRETQRKSKLKQLLILLCRVMIITFLVYAFAKPYKPVGFGEHKVSGSVVCIYIDNSFSMAAEGPEGIGIESAKQKAYSIVNASQPDTKFAILTNDLSEKHYRFYSKQEMINLIGEISESSRQTNLTTIILRFNNLTKNLLNETDKRVYLISDFQKNSSDLSNFKPDTLITYNFVPVILNPVTNIYLDTCWFETPAHHLDQTEILNIRIVNRSEEAYNSIPVNLFINDSLKALANIDLDANEKKTVSMQFTNSTKGLQQGKVEITDYPIVYDNTIYFSYFVKGANNSLLIKSGQQNTDIRNFQALFMNDAHIALDIVNDNRIQISNLKNYSSIFLYELTDISSGLSGELQKYVANGGNLTVIPAINSNLSDYNNLLTGLQAATYSNLDTVSIPISEVAFKHPLFTGVFKENDNKVQLPAIKKRFRFTTVQNISETSVMSFADKSNALTVKTYNKGKLYTFAFPFSEKENHFLDHLLFIPTIYNIALHASSNQQLYYVLGKDKYVWCNNPLETLTQNPVLRNTVSSKEIIPSIVKQEGNQIEMSIDENMDAGLYVVNVGKDQIDGIALNYNLTESDLTCYSPDDLRTLAGQAGIKHFNLLNEKNNNLSSAIAELDNGKQYWKTFILIAILFLLLEASIIKFWDKIFK
jgi:hypothetical protein